MDKQQKIDTDLDIQKLIKELVTEDEFRNAVLYLRADSQFDTSSIHVQGDARLLSASIQHQLHTNPRLKQLIFASIGSYLAKNPEAEQEFNAGVKLVKQTIN
nr:hypothetical protein [uncultured Draconibacterium sp.]